MTYSQEQAIIKKLFDDCLVILVSKASDYAKEGDCFSNFKKIATICDVPVEKVFLMFTTVKIARIVELLTKENKNESLEDSLMDLINYAALMFAYRKDNGAIN
jgi:CTP synthase (UTP-ammonia lyase)